MKQPWFSESSGESTGCSGESAGCSRRVFQQVRIAGEVTITPKIACGPLKVTCLRGKVIRDSCEDASGSDSSSSSLSGSSGSWSLSRSSGSSGSSGSSECTKPTKCRLVVIQDLCVEVPISFRAKANCEVVDLHCGPASTDSGLCSDHLSDSVSDSTASSTGDSGGSCSQLDGSSYEDLAGSDSGE